MIKNTDKTATDPQAMIALVEQRAQDELMKLYQKIKGSTNIGRRTKYKWNRESISQLEQRQKLAISALTEQWIARRREVEQRAIERTERKLKAAKHSAPKLKIRQRNLKNAKPQIIPGQASDYAI